MTPYELAYEYVMKTQRSLFLTGKAGTGKTTLLKRLRLECRKSMAVVAPTGVAAINAEGVTIHSFFQLPPQIFLPADNYRKALIREMRMDERKQRLLRNLELLIIDEVSMVRSDLLDTMDYVLRHFRRRHQQPFGGVQVLMIGDLYQLSPVVNERDWELMRDYYAGPYFFQSLVFREIQPIYIELDHVFRQQDEAFVRVLNQVRNNTLSSDSRLLLNSRYQPDWQQSDDEPFHITLSTHNHKVDAMNEREMAKLPGEEFEFRAKVKGTFPESMYPMDEVLRLKAGARVMFLKNDTQPEHAYFNGKLGVVSRISPKHVVVESEDAEGHKEQILVREEEWLNTRYVANEAGEIVPETAGSFTHLPLRPAWAVTIHKAQGLTFDHVVIDAADAFAAGQVYVALSRCRTLSGMVLLSPIPAGAMTCDPSVVQYVLSQAASSEAEQHLRASTEEYRRSLIINLFDFREALREVEGVQRFLRESGTFDMDVVRPLLSDIYGQLAELEDVAQKFRMQLSRILWVETIDEAFLEERLCAAAGYFEKQIGRAVHAVEKTAFPTEDKADGRKLEKRWRELQIRLYRTRHLISEMRHTPTIERYFDALSRFAFKDPPKTPKTLKTSKTTKTSKTFKTPKTKNP